MSMVVDERLQRLRSELDDHSRVADRLGLDLERPLRSLNDGYPENAISLVGKLTEKLLKELWRHHGIEGDPSGRALNDLVKRCQPHIRSSTVLNALDDIRRLRNRSTHDGYDISDEDGLLAVRRLVDVLVWFTSTSSSALLGGEPHMAPEVARRCEFLAGLYITLGYRQAKRFVLTSDTVYQLFCRESGMRLEYVELMVSQDVDDLRAVLTSNGGELLRTRLPKLTRFVILDGAGEGEELPGPVQELLGRDYRLVRYDSFIDRHVDLDAHLADVTSADCAEPRTAVTATVLSTDARTGESLIQTAEDAATLLGRLARGQANILITGRPGSGKSTLLRTLAADAGARRFRFYFDLGLKPRGETFPEYAARLLSPCMTADRSRAYDLFLYLIRSGSALCVLDAVDEGVDEASPAGFLRLFADLAPVLSAESTVVMSSRVSFLADSPQIRQLLDSGTARSEQLVEQMYANGLDPARVPHFHLVRLAEPDATPLEMRLTASLQLGSSQPLDALLGAHITKTLAERGQADTEERLPAVFGGAFLTDQTVFSLLDLHRDLGPGAFNNGRLELNSCVLAPCYGRPVRTRSPSSTPPTRSYWLPDSLPPRREPSSPAYRRLFLPTTAYFPPVFTSSGQLNGFCCAAYDTRSDSTATPSRSAATAVSSTPCDTTAPRPGTIPTSQTMSPTHPGPTGSANRTITAMPGTTTTPPSASAGGAPSRSQPSRASACPPRWSGKPQHAERTAVSFPGVTSPTARRSTVLTRGSVIP